MTEPTTTPSSSQIRSIDDLRGPAGRLEAVLNTGRDDARYAVVVCHPYPPAGGTMHNKVVYNAMKTFSSFGLPVVRFNFRGVGLSEGSFDDARGEQDDVRAVLDWMDKNLQPPILLAGFSFGSYVGLRASCGDARVKGLVGLGLPVRAAGRDYSYDFLHRCVCPKLFISGDHDQFCPREVMEKVLETAPQPKRLFWVEGGDHFFQGVPGSPGPKLDVMQGHLRDWLREEWRLSLI
jgi:hypothetical protein